MNIDIRSHYWPATPELREIKILIDGKVSASSFMSKDKIWDLVNQFDRLKQVLIDIAQGVE